jgi:hypothetical protein
VCKDRYVSKLLHPLLQISGCAKFGAGLYNPEEFSFTMDENPCEQTIQNLGKKSQTLKKKQQISKKLKQGCNAIFYELLICVVQMHYSCNMREMTQCMCLTVPPSCSPIF